MTKYKVFTPNANKKVEFTKEELEKLLNEVYNEGYTDGKASNWTIGYGDIITQPYTKVTSNSGITLKPNTNTDTITFNTTNTDGTTSKLAYAPSDNVTINKINT